MYSASTGDMIEQFTGAVNGTAQTGVGIGTVANTSPGMVYYQPNGEMDVYTMDGINNRLYMWNSTLALQNSGQFWYSMSGVVAWRPQSGIHPWSAGLQLNVTIPSIYGQFIVRICGNDIISTPAISGLYSGANGYGIQYSAYSTSTGAVLWSINHTSQFDSGDYAFGDGVFIIHDPVVSNWDCYSLTTGTLIWTSQPIPSWGNFVPHTPVIAYNCFYCGTYDGHVYCYNITNGQQIWAFSSGPDYGETPYGDLPMWYGPVIANNVVFMGTGDHENGAPLPKDEKLFAIDATTGQQLWNISGEMALAAIADGNLLAQNGDDNQIYCFGQGQTATTVTTSPVYNNPTQVEIKGTVTDQSPGQTCLGIPAAGTPAIADAYMSQWMEYLYEQQQEPMNAVGVPVTLSYVDPNNNTYTMGQTTSDIPGTYKITATFSGSNSYFGSAAQTIMTFNVPSAATATPTATSASMADTYFVPAIAGLFVLIIVVAIVLALLMLRKRP
jgi:outer membrane protein assembly factor BamB